MMCSIGLKTIAIQLTDIWSDCQTELTELSDRIVYLSDCLNRWQQMASHLTKCNETLVAIVEKCRIDYTKNSEIIVLINRFKEEEKCIESQRQDLRLIESRSGQTFTDNRVNRLVDEWNECKRLAQLSRSAEDKCTQTPDLLSSEPIECKLEDKSSLAQSNRNFDSIVNEMNVNNSEFIDSNGVNECQDLSAINLNVLNENSGFESLNDNKSDYVLSDEHLSDSSHGLQSVNDTNDSDFELSSLSNRKRKKIKSKLSDGLKQLDKSLLALKVDNQFVCNQLDCQFRTIYKNNYIRHLKAHETHGTNGDISIGSEVTIAKSKKQQRIDRAVLEFKVDNQYVCNESDCLFVSNNKRTFYSHLNAHKNPDSYVPNSVAKPKSKALVQKSEELVKIDELISNSIVNNRYVCSETNCAFESTLRQEFRKHLRQKHNPRPFMCDWPGCESQFKKFSHLKQHKECIHLDIRKYECDWPGCSAKLLTSHHFKIHKRTHTKERPWKCDWPGCEYSGSAQWCVIAHKRRHTGEKPYECPWPDCNYRCSQPCGLTQHKRKHTGEKPYRCAVEGCGKRFAAMAGLHSHRDTHHNRDSNWKRKNAKL